MSEVLEKTKFRFREMQAEILERFGSSRLEETAFPVYANTNGLASWLAWRRIHWAQELIKRVGPIETAVDFGCGLGPMLPFLVSEVDRVIGVDLDVEISTYSASRMGVRVPILSSIQDLGTEQVNLIVALDVLEHVDDLTVLLGQFRRALVPGGTVVVSGPTEGRLYRLARAVARSSGEGHLRTIDDIKDEIESCGFSITDEVVLPFHVPLFRVFLARLAP